MAMKKANEGGGIVWCHDTGSTCHASVKSEMGANGGVQVFASAETNSDFFDTNLGKLANDLNRLVHDATMQGISSQNKDAHLQIGFLVTGAGYLPVWKRDVAETEKLSDLVDINTLTDLDAMTMDRRDDYLKVAREAGGGEWHNHSSSGGVVHCHQAGMSCFVTVLSQSANAAQATGYFAKVAPGSPLYDAGLSMLADRMNTTVNQTQAAAIQANNKDPHLQIGFVSTGAGFLPVWKRVLGATERLDQLVGSNPVTHLEGLSASEIDRHFGVR